MKEKVCLFKLNIHYITKYIINHKKIVQELSTSHAGLCYKSCLHQPSTSDRQLTKKVVRVDSLT